MKYRIEIFLFAVAVVIFGAGTVYNRTMPVFVAQVDFGERRRVPKGNAPMSFAGCLTKCVRAG